VAVRTHEQASAGAEEVCLDEQLIEIFCEARNLAAQKNISYGNAWRHQGYMGNLARVMSKCARLKNMAWRDGSDREEVGRVVEAASEAELMDIINIAAFGVLNLRSGNRWGK
jgi:hypothetical protein